MRFKLRFKFQKKDWEIEELNVGPGVGSTLVIVKQRIYIHLTTSVYMELYMYTIVQHCILGNHCKCCYFCTNKLLSPPI